MGSGSPIVASTLDMLVVLGASRTRLPRQHLVRTQRHAPAARCGLVILIGVVSMVEQGSAPPIPDSDDLDDEHGNQRTESSEPPYISRVEESVFLCGKYFPVVSGTRSHLHGRRCRGNVSFPMDPVLAHRFSSHSG